MGYYDDNDLNYDPRQNYGSMISMDNTQPQQPSFLNSFTAGVQQRKKGQSPLLAGLAGQAGSGGFLGGLGSVAKFLL